MARLKPNYVSVQFATFEEATHQSPLGILGFQNAELESALLSGLNF